MFFLINLIKRNLLLSFFIFISLILTLLLMFFNSQPNPITLINTSLPTGTNLITIYADIPVDFYFSDKIKLETVSVTISPNTKFTKTIRDNDKNSILSISPNPWWEYNKKYTITIDKNLVGAGGGRLKENIVFYFSLSYPTKEEELPTQPGPP